MKYLILVGLLLSSAAFGKAIFYGSETEQLRVKRYGTTLLRFDHQVKTISQAENFVILPADTNNPNYSLLSIKPRNSKGGTLTFILDNGAVVSVKVNVASRKSVEGLDQFFDFKAKDQRINGEDRKAVGSNISDIDLMKAMIRNEIATERMRENSNEMTRMLKVNVAIQICPISSLRATVSAFITSGWSSMHTNDAIHVR